MFTLHLSHLDIRTAALAVAEAARKRAKDDSLHTASRRLADRLAEAVPETLTRGEARLDLREDEWFVLATSLNLAARGSGYYRPSLPITSPRALAARLEA